MQNNNKDTEGVQFSMNKDCKFGEYRLILYSQTVLIEQFSLISPFFFNNTE